MILYLKVVSKGRRSKEYLNYIWSRPLKRLETSRCIETRNTINSIFLTTKWYFNWCSRDAFLYVYKKKKKGTYILKLLKILKVRLLVAKELVENKVEEKWCGKWVHVKVLKWGWRKRTKKDKIKGWKALIVCIWKWNIKVVTNVLLNEKRLTTFFFLQKPSPPSYIFKNLCL